MPFCETQPGRGSGLTGPSPARVFKEATLAARKAGDKAEARRQLLALTERDDRNELAWLWLAGVAESSDEALEWLGRVLEINPSNERAKASLEWHLARSAPQAPGQECPVCSLQFARPRTALFRVPGAPDPGPPRGVLRRQAGR